MKTKALIIFAVTAKLICAFVFAYVKHLLSHDVAHFKNKILVRITAHNNFLSQISSQVLSGPTFSYLTNLVVCDSCLQH